MALGAVLAAYTAMCHSMIASLLRAAVSVDRHERWAIKRGKRLRGPLLRLLRRWMGWPAPRRARGGGGRIPWNRTPAAVEDTVLQLHLRHRDLGGERLRALLRRTVGVRITRQTVRNILARGPRVSVAAPVEPVPPRRIDVRRPRQLWGIDLTLVLVLGFFPVWLLGVVDYHGSRLMVLERLTTPTAAHVSAALERAFDLHGRPERILTDNGSVFRSSLLDALLTKHGVAHAYTRPAHPWTNGRVERLFRTFKETVFTHIWLFASVREIDRYCRDFILFYNRDRPHSRFDDRTPDEVYFGSAPVPRPLGGASYFDGHLEWYRFG
jgi:putative transposase